MSIIVSPHHPLFFAEVEGVDLTRPMTQASFAEIEAAFHEHAVLLFRDQSLTDAQQVSFSEFFGPLFKVTNYAWRNETPRIRLDVTDISNIDHEGRLLAEASEILAPDSFLLRAILMGVLSSIVLGFTGTFVVVRRTTYVSAALSHCIIGGIGAALYLKYVWGWVWLDPRVGALIVVLSASWLIAYLRLRTVRQST